MTGVINTQGIPAIYSGALECERKSWMSATMAD